MRGAPPERTPDGAPAGAPLVACVPNVSEGRDRARLERFSETIRAAPGVTLMNVHADPDHHRAVFSYLGPAPAVEQATLALAEVVLEAIDLRTHRGVHPRIGALDVVPFVPLGAAPMADAVALARRVGRAIADRHRVPVYYYGHAATRPTRRGLPHLRRDGYDGLAARLADDPPDEGPARFDPRSGATLVGARDVLVAFNVWLEGDDLDTARAIAHAVRESSGGLPAVQAMGVRLASRRLVQVSMNLVDYRVTPLPIVFDRVREEAERRKIRVLRSEVVGVAPRAALAGRPPESLGLAGVTPELWLDTHLAAPITPGRARATPAGESHGGRE